MRHAIWLAALMISLPLSQVQAAGGTKGQADQVPPYADNGPNIVWHWIEDGGARLYWNTLLTPLQIRLAGASFRDPADVPPLEIVAHEKKARPARARHRVRRSARPTRIASGHAPADAGSTRLRRPEKPQSSARTPVSHAQRANRAGRSPGPEPTTYTDLDSGRGGTVRQVPHAASDATGNANSMTQRMADRQPAPAAAPLPEPMTPGQPGAHLGRPRPTPARTARVSRSHLLHVLPGKEAAVKTW